MPLVDYVLWRSILEKRQSEKQAGDVIGLVSSFLPFVSIYL